MVRDGFALAIGVGCEDDFENAIRFFAQILDDLALAANRYVFRLEPIFYIHAQLALRQVTHVTDRSSNRVVGSEIFTNRLRLGRRFYDDETLLLLCLFSH